MYRLFAVLACALLLFSGCVDVFIDVVHNSNGSFTLRKMVAVDDSLFDMMQQFAASMGDTNKQTKRQMLDSMEHQFSWERDSLLATKGVQWYATRDSEASGRTFIFSEIGVKDAASLEVAANALFRTLDSKKHESDNEESRPALRCKTSAAGTSLNFYFTKNTKPEQSSADQEMAEKLFAGHGLHIRVFSPALAVTKDKKVYPIEGGQEWLMPMTSMMDNKRLAKSKVTFMLSGVK